MEKTKKPAVKAPAKTSAAKPATTAIKTVIEKNLKDSEKITDSICEVITKRILNHKNASQPGATDVNGLGKNDVLKLIGFLDNMGSTTYKTACALRELAEKMG